MDPQYAEQFPGVGAQYVWCDLPALMWAEIAELSIQAFAWLKTVPAPSEDVFAVQAWCAEMYVAHLVAIREGWEPRIAPELLHGLGRGPSQRLENRGGLS